MLTGIGLILLGFVLGAGSAAVFLAADNTPARPANDPRAKFYAGLNAALGAHSGRKS